MNFDKAIALQKKRNSIIPGGGHTYAKGDDQYPEHAPLIIEKGKGCRVWDIDGNEFIEYGMGLRAVTLGHAFRPVLEAVERQIQLGVNFTRPSPLEVECAEKPDPAAQGPRHCDQQLVAGRAASRPIGGGRHVSRPSGCRER